LDHACIQLLLVFGSRSRRQLPANLEINRLPSLLTCLRISGQLAKFGNVSLVILFNLIGSNIGRRARRVVAKVGVAQRRTVPSRRVHRDQSGPASQTGGAVLQPAGHGGAVDQGRQERRQMDPPEVSLPSAQSAGWGRKIGGQEANVTKNSQFETAKWLATPSDGRIIAKTTQKTQFAP
jgi:hypothetical protein